MTFDSKTQVTRKIAFLAMFKNGSDKKLISVQEI